MIGQLAGDRLHPHFVRIGGAARKVDAACFQFHDKEQIERCQATLRPDFHGREVDRSHHVPMRLEECFPGSCAPACRSRLNAVSFEDIANGGVTDVVADVQ